MVYPYGCTLCGHNFDVIKRLAQIDRPENCPKCRGIAERGIAAPHVHSSAGDWNRVEFNHGLGCWTKGNKHAEQIAKSKGLEPIGNEPPEKIHKYFEKKREETREARYEEATREKVFE